jgi:putative DNA primase/helicase
MVMTEDLNCDAFNQDLGDLHKPEGPITATDVRGMIANDGPDAVFKNPECLMRIYTLQKSDPVVYHAIREIARECKIPNKVFDALMKHVREAIDPKPTDGYQLSDIGNAQRLVSRHGQDIRYLYEEKQWLVWDGKRWVRDGAGLVMELTKGIITSLLSELGEASGDTKKWLEKMQDARHVYNTVKLAQSDRRITISTREIDAHRHLLNTPSGTVNLKTGEVYAHRREDYLTRMTVGDYIPGTRLDLWENTLMLFQPEETGREALQTAMGYGLIGENPEKTFFFAVGHSNTGKTTMFDAAVHALGPDYAMTGSFDTFCMQGSMSRAERTLYRARDKRVIYAEEASEEARFSIQRLKALTGGANQESRGLYKEALEYDPEFVVWLAANHSPNLSYDDNGSWFCIVVIPFDQVIPEERRVSDTHARLKNDHAAHDAVLTWLIEGCLKYF